MADVTYYVALPFVFSDEGVAAGEATECFSVASGTLPARERARNIRCWRVSASSHAVAGGAATAGACFSEETEPRNGRQGAGTRDRHGQERRRTQGGRDLCGAGLLLSLSAAMVFPDLWSALF